MENIIIGTHSRDFKEVNKRLERLRDLYPDYEFFTTGNYLAGDPIINFGPCIQIKRRQTTAKKIVIVGSGSGRWERIKETSSIFAQQQEQTTLKLTRPEPFSMPTLPNLDGQTARRLRRKQQRKR